MIKKGILAAGVAALALGAPATSQAADLGDVCSTLLPSGVQDVNLEPLLSGSIATCEAAQPDPEPDDCDDNGGVPIYADLGLIRIDTTLLKCP